MTTVAGETSAVEGVLRRNSTRCSTPAALAFARDSSMRLGIDVDADAAGAVRLRRGNRNPAIPAAEVEDHVVSGRPAPARACDRRRLRRSGRTAPGSGRPGGGATSASEASSEQQRAHHGVIAGRPMAADAMGSIIRAASRCRRWRLSDRKPFPHMALTWPSGERRREPCSRARDRKNRRKVAVFSRFSVAEAPGDPLY